MKSRSIDFILTIITLAVSLVLYAPLFVPIAASFFETDGGEPVWNHPSLQSYADLLANSQILSAFKTTILVGACVVICSLLLGTMLAVYNKGRRPGGRFAETLILIPFVMPPIITGLSLLIFFRIVHLERSVATVVIGHCVFVLAIVYRTILARLQSISPSMIEASFDLGASRIQTFRKVVLPNIASALIGAGVLAFALSFDETMISILVTGTQSTLPVTLWAMMRVGFSPDVNALVALILGVTIIFCLLLSKLLLPRRTA